jgi:L-arabinose isomerase
MIDLKQYEVWFATGSQHLYGPEALQQVARNSQAIVDGLNASGNIALKIIFKPVLTTPEAIHALCLEANSRPNCIGLIMWMHTFSPAKMWISGLKTLAKPFVHLHTQANRDIPWDTIDMDFMNLNQAAHGDREFGFICSRMGKMRKVVVGYWQDASVQQRLNVWTRVASAWADAQGAKIARFGDNMRDVAVTEGDKVEAQIRFGYSVNGYGVGDLVKSINEVSDTNIKNLIAEYDSRYTIAAAAKKAKSFQRMSMKPHVLNWDCVHFLQQASLKPLPRRLKIYTDSISSRVLRFSALWLRGMDSVPKEIGRLPDWSGR